MDIERNRELHVMSVIALRKKIPQQEITNEIVNIERFMRNNALRKNGPVVTSVIALDNDKGNQLIDLEIIVPVDKIFQPEQGYIFKHEFHIKNAVRLKFRDKPEKLQQAYSAISAYVRAHGLTPVTSYYNVYINNHIHGHISENTEVDIYLGVAPSL